MSSGRENDARGAGREEISVLASRWRAGEHSALREVIRRFQAPLLSYAMSLLGSLNDAEDVVQETWIRAHGGIRDLRDPSGLWAWLRRIAHNSAMDAAKRARRHEAPEDPSALEIQAAHQARVGGENGTDEGTITLGAIIAAIENLPETYREAAVYHYLQEWPHADIAVALGISEEAARQRVSRAGRLLRSALRQAREEECHDL